ncbi:MAG: PKD domain-containing protein [Cyclobacteriaceae bacterium]|nr:PKD domain-containing protein [Cyclobacteriaceae bacterium]
MRCFFLVGLISVSSHVLGQAPYVNTVDKNAARAQETITIQGINFGTNPAAIKVNFGNVSVSPITISDQLLEVPVPAGAAFDNIGVLNTTNGLSGYAKKPFFVSFGGSNPFVTSQLSTQSDFNSESGLYDLALADFDGDGKQDAATANDNSTNIAVFLNTSASGSVSYTRSTLTPGFKTLHVSAADLNGDSKPEILVSELNGPRVFIFKNNSSIGSLSFSAPISITLTGGKLSTIGIRDLDLDGKPDLVVTDHAFNRIFVVPNQSTIASIQLGTPAAITVASTSVTDGLAIGDLDGDALPEVVTSEFLSPSGKIFVLKNQSTPGTIKLTASLEIVASTTISNLKIGDIDGDSKPDLAATALLASSVFVFLNQSTSASIQFAAPASVSANSRPWGIDFGDMDGDGKLDMVVASITQKAVTVLNNQSTAGSVSFLTQTINTSFINRHVRIADADVDGRPDISFTSIDDNNLGIPASKISVFKNLNCVLPVITPAGPITICSGVTQRITASNSISSTYEWFKDGISMGAPGASTFIDVTATGQYTVTLTNGACSKTSSAVSITVVVAAPLGTATPNPVTPVCIGGTLTLSVNDVGATNYIWTGPNAFSQQGRSVSSPNFQASQAGKYSVDIMVGTCKTQTASVIVDAVVIPDVNVTFVGNEIICQGQTKQYSISPSPSGYTYQWAEQTTGDVTGATGATYTATTTGNYLVKLRSIVNPTCATVQTTAKKVRIVKNPVVDFTAPSTGCIGQTLDFTDQSVVDSDPTGLDIQYAWDFGDASSASTKNTTHAYAAAQTFNPKLAILYNSVGCQASKQKGVAIQAAPALAITNLNNIYSFCPTDSLKLEVAGAFDSYAWSNGKTTTFSYYKTGGDASIEVMFGTCKIKATKPIVKFNAPTVIASADPASIKPGETSQFTASGLVDYTWTPATDLTDALISNPVASPLLSTTYKVKGKDTNGCAGEGTIPLVVIQDNALSSLVASNILSPDLVDTQNDTWVVKNSESLPQCGVTIYDEHGFKVYEAKPYLNDWKGTTTSGKILPAGVYYYILRCDDSSGDYVAGSINLIR